MSTKPQRSPERLTEALPDALDVIVVPTTSLTTFEQTLQHRFLVRREEEHQR
jgi:hypothetical protein